MALLYPRSAVSRVEKCQITKCVQIDPQLHAEAASMLGTLGIDYEKPAGFTYSNSQVGTVEYSHGEGKRDFYPRIHN